MNFTRIVGFQKNNCEESLRIFSVNFENIRNFGKNIEKNFLQIFKKFQNIKMLIDKKILRKYIGNFEKSMEQFQNSWKIQGTL